MNNLDINDKNNFKFGFFSKKVPIFLFGTILLLIVIIAFFNSYGLSSLILYAFSYVFGMFSYVILPLIGLYGLYLMAFMKFPKLKFSFSGLGIIFIILFSCLASSMNVEDLSIGNFSYLYNSEFQSKLVNSIQLSNQLVISSLYGGFLGYMFASLFMTGLGYAGTICFEVIFLLIGAILILRAPILALYVFIRDYMLKKKAKMSQEKIETEEKIQKKIEESENDVQTQEIDFGNQNDNLTLNTKTTIFDPKPEKEDLEDTTYINDISPMAKAYSQYEKNSKANLDETGLNIFYNKNKEVVKPEDNNLFKTDTLGNVSSANLVDSKLDDASLNRNENIDSSTLNQDDTANEIDFVSSNGNVISEDETDNSLEDEIQFSSPFKENNSETISYKSQPSVSEVNYNDTLTSSMDKKVENKIDVETTNINKEEFKSPTSLQKPMSMKHYVLPSINLLQQNDDFSKLEVNQQAAEAKIGVINGVFDKLHIGAHVKDFTIGPSVTRFNIERDEGVKVSEITKEDVLNELQVDLCGDMSVRIEGVVQGSNTSGIEIGNAKGMTVSFKECYGEVLKKNDRLTIPLGKTISNEVITTSLDDMPHLLIAGTTGSGKSVFVHSIIMSLIMRNYPDQLKLILVDPKTVEFSKYKDIPHLYCPIITNITQAVSMLKKLCDEMDRRYSLLSRFECSKLQEYNELRKDNPDMEILPNIVCIIDEFADMMMQDPKNVDSNTQRIAQKARAAGIYLIIATQRPTVKCITGTIKANIPARVALALPSGVDSRTILDEVGAETLLGHGDMLARIPSLKAIVRLQSPFVSGNEISMVSKYLKQQCQPQYNKEFINFNEGEHIVGKLGTSFGQAAGFKDELYETAKSIVIENHIASTSFLQRKLSIGYSRAASLIDALEEEGIVKSLPNGRKEVIAENSTDESEN